MLAMGAFARKLLGRLIAVAAVIVMSIAGTAVAEASAATGQAGGELAYASINFAQHHVDASGGHAAVTLTWQLTDSNPDASYVAGEIDIRMAGDTAGTFIGRTYQIQYDLNGSPDGDVTATGTAQNSSYSYAFPVPQYANAKEAKWVVTKATALDDQGDTLSKSGAALDGFSATLNAKELADTTPPTYQGLAITPVNGGSHPYVYDNGVAGSMGYSLEVQEPESGFWKGTIRLKGPGDQTLHGAFAFTSSENQGESCGNLGGGDDFDTSCGVELTIPAGTAAGTWVVSGITLVSNAGISKTYGNLNAVPIVVTGDTGLSATGFTASPNPVNNWINVLNPVQITMTVAGAQQGISAIYVDAANAAPCQQFNSTPTVNQDGTVSVSIDDFQGTAVCQIGGIAIVDGAGNVALYGSEYNAPDPGVTITRVPDTTAPTATSASLTPTSLPASQTFDNPFTLTLQVVAPIAPVNQLSIYAYDSSGNEVFEQSGGVSPTPTGQLQNFFNLSEFLPAGTYTVGFTLTDEGGLSTSYGTPGGQPMPGGPLQFTVTP
jgi:hypothetical protein